LEKGEEKKKRAVRNELYTVRKGYGFRRRFKGQKTEKERTFAGYLEQRLQLGKLGGKTGRPQNDLRGAIASSRRPVGESLYEIWRGRKKRQGMSLIELQCWSSRRSPV